VIDLAPERHGLHKLLDIRLICSYISSNKPASMDFFNGRMR
jgi:hypothetical protein